MLQLLAVIIERGVMDLNHPFTYAYIGDRKILKGTRVRVKFGFSELIGFVVEEPKIFKTSLEEYLKSTSIKIREIEDIIDEQPILNDELIDLAKKVSAYYFCPFIEILKAMLPPSLRPDTSYINKPRRSFKDMYIYNEGFNPDSAELTANEKKLLDKFSSSSEGFKKSQITSKVAFESLLEKGMIKHIKVENLRRPEVESFSESVHSLNSEQEKAFKEIRGSSDGPFLLQGVTGSGKTEIYIRLIQDALDQNKGSLVLVPEISLTDMLISRLKGIFKDQIALIHSGLTDSQKYDEYIRIARGDALIVVGARSAVFAPIHNLGLLIIDEEHVESYKQDTMPFYDARKVALMRTKSKAKLVFGSATPSLECRARADKGYYRLIRLDNRYNNVNLPSVDIVDLSDYHNIDYQSTMISIPLRKKIQECLDDHKQAILLLNRRGYSPTYICRKCQKPLVCPNCNIPLTYHRSEHLFKCHHCDYILEEKNLTCPNCQSHDFTYLGFGTERIVEQVQALFPKSRIVRFDADTAKKKGAYHRIITDFSIGKYDIMIGTQMVAKGHDFPNVRLAAALLADQSLMFPSYKANEDTFDLLTQLVGRAGRREGQGEAVIQTYNKDNDTIKLSCSQDYESFYRAEMINRHDRIYPPYVFLMTLIISGKDKEKTDKASWRIKNYLVGEIARPEKRAQVFGPSIPYIEKKANRYYRTIMIKYKSREKIEQSIAGISVLQLNASDIKVAIDVDPSSDIL